MSFTIGRPDEQTFQIRHLYHLSLMMALRATPIKCDVEFLQVGKSGEEVAETLAFGGTFSIEEVPEQHGREFWGFE